MTPPPGCRTPSRHTGSWHTVDGRALCQTCETWKIMVSVTAWQGATPGQDARQRTATVGAVDLDEARRMLPWAVNTVARALGVEPPDDYVEGDEGVEDGALDLGL